jgi:hypothetical protein
MATRVRIIPIHVQREDVIPLYAFLKGTEHFSCHTGPIAYLSKVPNSVDPEYYKEPRLPGSLTAKLRVFFVQKKT